MPKNTINNIPESPGKSIPKSSPANNSNNISNDFPAAFTFKIAIAGQGPLLLRLHKIISSASFKSSMPSLSLSALFLYNEPLRPEYQLPELQKLAVYNSAKDLFAGESDLRLVLSANMDSENEDNANYQLDLRKYAPIGVNILSPSATLFICNAIEKDLLAIGGGARIRSIRHSFMALINQMDEEIIVLDNDGYVIDVNNFFVKSRNGLPEDYLGKTCGEIVGTEYCCDKESDITCMWKKPIDQRENFTKVYNVVNAEGQMEYFRVVIIQLPPDGDHNYSVFMRKNITSVIRLENQLQQSQKMAAIGELSTYIAHEIRNPLFAIGGFANALLRTPSLDDAAREKAKVILEESQRLDGILKSIINFARPTTPDITDLDVAAMVHKTLEIITMGDTERGINTVENIAPGLPRARGNAELLKQGIINIIKNAQEAMPQGGSIELSASHVRHMIEIRIHDTGPGIPKEEQKKIFSPFYSTKGKGAGLGLAMTKKYIEDMGGQLHLHSEPGQGTTLIIQLLPALATESHSLSMVKTPRNGTSITLKIPPAS